jgi:hypothetical protein
MQYPARSSRAAAAPDSRLFTLPSAVVAVAVAWAAALACQAAFAADGKTAAKPAAAASSTYVADRSNCDQGRTAQDRETCLKEAGAAQDERRRNRLDTSGDPAANATARCDNVPAKDKADCLARIGAATAPNQRTTTSGSVAGGGVIRETTTTYPGVAASAAMGTTPARPASAPK